MGDCTLNEVGAVGLLVGGLGGFAVVFDVSLGRFRRVVGGMVVMAIGSVSVMSREMMVTCLMVPRGFAMMSSRVVVMFGCFTMMLCCLF
ncbi:MAG: hypothetical protein WBR26_18465 [Candidatus Acidiferrum sp.]